MPGPFFVSGRKVLSSSAERSQPLTERIFPYDRPGNPRSLRRGHQYSPRNPQCQHVGSRKFRGVVRFAPPTGPDLQRLDGTGGRTLCPPRRQVPRTRARQGSPDHASAPAPAGAQGGAWPFHMLPPTGGLAYARTTRTCTLHTERPRRHRHCLRGRSCSIRRTRHASCITKAERASLALRAPAPTPATRP